MTVGSDLGIIGLKLKRIVTPNHMPSLNLYDGKNRDENNSGAVRKGRKKMGLTQN